jgi:FkbM family methyltransferase
MRNQEVIRHWFRGAGILPHKSEYLLFGPYIELDPGTYTASFEIANSKGELGYVDVCCDTGHTILCRKIFSDTDLHNCIAFEFAAPKRALYEFRVFAYKGSDLKLINRSLPGRYNGHDIVLDKIVPRKSECLLSGPYIELDPGTYTVSFEISANGEGELGYVDVCCDTGHTILCRKTFSDADLHSSIALEFTAPKRADYEFRVFAYEGSDLKLINRSLPGRYNGHDIVLDKITPRKSECLLFGPYIQLDPGTYTVSFEISGNGEGELGYVDVCCDTGYTILCRKIFSDTDLHSSIALEFTAPKRALYEFRVFAYEGSDLKLINRSLIGRYNDRDIVLDEFHLRNSGLFTQIAGFDGSVTMNADGYVLNFRDILLTVENHEDWQIISEILVGNVYHFSLKEPCCVIDIGMNVGVASLFFASLPHVQEVYSFEPFPAPFARGIKHFGLNPKLAQKIRPQNVGLGNRTQSHTVLYDDASTIGVSIHGQGRGEPTSINIVSASEALRDIIRCAQGKGLEIVMKIDCEGSEFAIFDDLLASGLIDIPRAYLIEWHKWWSVDLRDTNLVQPLVERSYVVLNRTSPAASHAGLIYAMRYR